VKGQINARNHGNIFMSDEKAGTSTKYEAKNEPMVREAFIQAL
jgi:hypothetical protein